jgi:hypothetical protein
VLVYVQAAEQLVEASDQQLNALISDGIRERTAALDPEAGRRISDAMEAVSLTAFDPQASPPPCLTGVHEGLISGMMARELAYMSILGLAPRDPAGALADFYARLQASDADLTRASEELATVLQTQFGDSLAPTPKPWGSGVPQ